MKTFYLTQVKDDWIAHEIQKKQEEGRNSESEKNKITVNYSFQPIFVSLILGLYCDSVSDDFQIASSIIWVHTLFTSPQQLSGIHNLNYLMLIFAFYKYSEPFW
jgi:hypothetical protein